MITPHRTLQQALDALEDSYLSDERRNYELQAKAITALREALAAPAPAAPVVPLTDGQIRQIVRDTFDVVPLPHDITFARAIEKAHGITGGA